MATKAAKKKAGKRKAAKKLSGHSYGRSRAKTWRKLATAWSLGPESIAAETGSDSAAHARHARPPGKPRGTKGTGAASWAIYAISNEDLERKAGLSTAFWAIPPSGWIVVADLARTMQSILRSGANVIVPETSAPHGRLAILRNRSGDVIGLWEDPTRTKTTRKARATEKNKKPEPHSSDQVTQKMTSGSAVPPYMDDYDEDLLAREPLPWRPSGVAAEVRAIGRDSDIGRAVRDMASFARRFGGEALLYFEHGKELELGPQYVEADYKDLSERLRRVQSSADRDSLFYDIALGIEALAKRIYEAAYEAAEYHSPEIIDAARHLKQWSNCTGVEIRGREETRRAVEEMLREMHRQHEVDRGRPHR